MERENNPQLELFSQKGEGVEVKANPANLLLTRIWNHEKVILIIIAILITGIISFSLGVERGKKIVSEDKEVKLLEQVKTQEVDPVSKPMVKKDEAVKPVFSAMQQQGAFTIQGASFKAKVNAQKEAEVLKKRGFDASILTKDSYIILCVGKFSKKEEATSFLGKLRKQYKDCLIREL